MPALSISAPGDALLGVVAPVGLACAAGTALVVDLDQSGPAFAGSASLADVVEAGPRKADLVPERRGVAILRNGGIAAEGAEPVLEALISGWPAVVLRLGESGATFGNVRKVSVHPLLPGLLLPPVGDHVVYQRTSWSVGPPGPGTVLPRPSRQAVGRILTGREPGPSRWVSAWGEVWKWAA